MKWSHFCLLASAIWLTPHISEGSAYVLGLNAMLFGFVLAWRGE